MDLTDLRKAFNAAYEAVSGGLTMSAEAHDAALRAVETAVREQIAREVKVEMRRHDSAQVGFSAIGDAYAHAARIARGEQP